jgi:hypothetical protein
MVCYLGLTRLSGWIAAVCDALHGLGYYFAGALATLGYLGELTRCPIWTAIIVGHALQVWITCGIWRADIVWSSMRM